MRRTSGWCMDVLEGSHAGCPYKGMNDPSTIGCDCSCHPENNTHTFPFRTCRACQPHRFSIEQVKIHAEAMGRAMEQGGLDMATKNKQDTTDQPVAMRPVDIGRWQSKAEREEKAKREAARLAEYAAELAEAKKSEQAARDRFAAAPDAQYAFHLHHEILFEGLTGQGGPERIDYIVRDKPLSELATRLRLIRPVPNDKLPETLDWDALQSAAQKRYDDANVAYNRAQLKNRGATRQNFEGGYYNLVDNPTDEQLQALIEVATKYVEENSVLTAARIERDAAFEELSRVKQRKQPFSPEQIEALHKELCEADCPWNGTTILPSDFSTRR